ncbi:26188_t:CDS:1, partial [Gigaspora margarita]
FKNEYILRTHIQNIHGTTQRNVVFTQQTLQIQEQIMRVNEHVEIENLRKSLDYQYNELIEYIKKLKGLYQYLIECGLV